MNKIDQLFRDNRDNVAAFTKGYFAHLSALLDQLDTNQIALFVHTVLKTRDSGGTIYFLGNGGSAATASHFANDYGIGTRSPHKPFRAISLTDNSAAMTAIGNDFGYDELFKRQLQNMGVNKGDVVVAISASGNSPNVLLAVEYAKSMGATIVGMTGFDGGKLLQMSDISLHVGTSKGEYGPVEDIHMIFDHVSHAYLSCIVREEV